MKHNVGGTDRVLRIIAGLVIVAAGFYFQSWWGALGLIPLLTGSISWCPVYLLFGISSCASDKENT